MNPGDQRKPGILELRNDLPKIINCVGLNKSTDGRAQVRIALVPS